MCLEQKMKGIHVCDRTFVTPLRFIKVHRDGVSCKRMESLFGKKSTAYRSISSAHRQFATESRVVLRKIKLMKFLQNSL